jgi:hypothetical protein
MRVLAAKTGKIKRGANSLVYLKRAAVLALHHWQSYRSENGQQVKQIVV